MKPIYECLDYLLNHLLENRFKPEGHRLPFDVDHKVIPDLHLQNHEEFKGLVDMLVEDRFAFFLDGKKDDLEHYRHRTMITPRGIDLKNKGGYKEKINRENSEKNHSKAIANQTLMLTLILAIGATIASLYYLTELYWKYGWFQNSLYCWLVGMTILVAALTSFLMTRLLYKKQQAK